MPWKLKYFLKIKEEIIGEGGSKHRSTTNKVDALVIIKGWIHKH